MKPLLFKELKQFFGNLTGFLSVGLFLLLMGLFLFVFPETSLLDYGYATLDKFFEMAPWIMLLLVPAVTMRSFSDEFRGGTWEILKTRPLTLSKIIGAKYLAAVIVVLLALVPTFFYVLTIKLLSINGSIDSGAIAGSYIGLICLVAVFTAIGICSSALTSNPIISFLLAAFVCYAMYKGFTAVSAIPALQGNAGYWISLMGIDDHYRDVSRGVLALQDAVYFAAIAGMFLLFTRQLISRK